MDAADLKWGASNTEIIRTNSGPKLIELNPRLHGSFSQLMASMAIGTTQPLETARAYIAPAAFQEEAGKGIYPCLSCGKVYLINRLRGKLKKLPSWSTIFELKSFVGLQSRWAIDQEISPTRDLASSPGVIYLAAANKEDLASDYANIRELEEHALYKDVLG